MPPNQARGIIVNPDVDFHAAFRTHFEFRSQVREHRVQVDPVLDLKQLDVIAVLFRVPSCCDNRYRVAEILRFVREPGPQHWISRQRVVEVESDIHLSPTLSGFFSQNFARLISVSLFASNPRRGVNPFRIT